VIEAYDTVSPVLISTGKPDSGIEEEYGGKKPQIQLRRYQFQIKDLQRQRQAQLQ
jgi:hypothetical protein